MRGRAWLSGAAVVLLAVTACGGQPADRLSDAVAVLEIPSGTPTSQGSPTTPAPSTAPPPQAGEDCTASKYPPMRPLPRPGAMPRGTFMHRIQTAGQLTVAVDQNTTLFGYFNPRTSRIEGFDIDIAREVAKAIFGTDEGRLTLRAVLTSQRIPFVKDGTVDLAVDAVTITCSRTTEVHFSTVYFEANQKTLVRSDSSARSLGDLRGRKVCATVGSTALQIVSDPSHGVVPYPVSARTDCLVALQSGVVDGIQSDDAILYGFLAQDPYTKILPRSYHPEPYGIAIAQAHPEFVAFVDGVLENLRASGRWAQLYEKWLGPVTPTVPSPPVARYATGTAR